MGHRSWAILLALAILAAATAVRADAMADLPYRIGGDGRVSTDVYVDDQGPFPCRRFQ